MVNMGLIIGTIAFVLGIVALIAALILRNQQNVSQAQLIRSLYSVGIPVLLLVSFGGFWKCLNTGDWTHCLEPIAFLFLALAAITTIKKTTDSQS
jgi:predicted membrane channel-forming protein YqfA (hemolysin III family)